MKIDNKEELKNYIKSNCDTVVVFFVFVIMHAVVKTNYWDDKTLMELVRSSDFSMLNHLIRIWNTWSSRIFLEVVQLVALWLPSLFWRIIDTVLWVKLYANIKKIVSNALKYEFDIKDKFLFLLFFMSIPASLFATAGWIVTTINFLWIFFALSECCLIIQKSLCNRIRWYEYVYFAIMLLFATNYEMAGLISFIMLPCMYYFFRKKEANNSFGSVIVTGELIALINVIMLIICPGNVARQVADAQYHDSAGLLELNMLGNIRMGINSCLYHFLSIPNVLLFTTLFIFALVTIVQRKRKIVCFLGIIPVVLDVFLSAYIFIKYALKTRAITYVYPDAMFEVCGKIEQYIVMLSAIVIVLIITILLYLLIDNKRLAVFTILFFYIVGLMPQVALGFTTTVSASCIRVVLYLYYAFLVLDIVLLTETIWKNRIYLNKIYKFLAFLGSTGMMLSILQLIRHIMVYG